MKKSYLFLITLLLLSNNLVFGQIEKYKEAHSVDSKLAKQLQTVLDEGINSRHVVGASAAVIIPNKGTWLGVSGFSDPSASDSMRPDMLLGIGSITKTFTAALILQLFEENRLDLDDSIHQYLPHITYIDSSITIRQLLNHTSGIFDIAESSALTDSNDVNPDKFWTPAEIL